MLCRMGQLECKSYEQPLTFVTNTDAQQLGIFLCMRCAALHRKLGTHISKVKSLSMDSWTNDQVDVSRLNQIFLDSLLTSYGRTCETSAMSNQTKFTTQQISSHQSPLMSTKPILLWRDLSERNTWIRIYQELRMGTDPRVIQGDMTLAI